MSHEFEKYLTAAERRTDSSDWVFRAVQIEEDDDRIIMGEYGFIPYSLFSQLSGYSRFKPEDQLCVGVKYYPSYDAARAAVQRVIDSAPPPKRVEWQDLPICDFLDEHAGILCGNPATRRVRYDDDFWFYRCPWHARVEEHRQV